MTTLGDTMGSCKALLLDFDGPVCDLFAARPATSVAEHMLDSLLNAGLQQQPLSDVRSSPHRLLQWTAARHSELAAVADQALSAEELAAADGAVPTPGAYGLLTNANARNLSVAIVSSNAQSAIQHYLMRHHLAGYVAAVIGRPEAPRLMKPHPSSVLEGVERLGLTPQDCVFIGDAPSDIEAGRSAGTHTIGYAKRPARWRELRAAQADHVIGDMRELAVALPDLEVARERTRGSSHHR